MADKDIRQVFLDMDGVLADFELGLQEMLGHKIDLKGVSDVYDNRKRELTAKHLFRNLKPMPDAWKLIDWALNSGIHTEILTAAGTVNRTIVIKDNLPISIPTCIIFVAKHAERLSFLSASNSSISNCLGI